MYKLLIAEDEPLERLALRKLIERKYRNIELIIEATNGAEAVEKAKTYRPSIILMDIRMPELTGLEAQKRIIKFLTNTKTIIITAYNEFDYAQQAIRYGVTDYLLKPVRPEELYKSIDAAIESLQNTTSKWSAKDVAEDHTKDTLESALEYIEKNYLSSQLTLQTVSQLVHLNPQYFSRLFRKKMGMTFTEYITKLRIEKAKKLLSETNQPIYRIAVEVGFSDPAYFTKVFQKHENISPFKYRQEMLQNY